MEERHGFIQDMLDVKVLILYVVNNVMYPVTLQEIYELSYQDDRLSYFDVSIAIPEMVESGHLEELPGRRYTITEKGKQTYEITEDSIAYPVKQRTKDAVALFNRKARRDDLVRTEIIARKEGDFSVVMGLDDESGNLMTLELMAPSREQAQVLSKAYKKNADRLYQVVMMLLLDEAGAKDDGNV